MTDVLRLSPTDTCTMDACERVCEEEYGQFLYDAGDISHGDYMEAAVSICFCDHHDGIIEKPLQTASGDRVLEAQFFPGGDGTVDAWVVLCHIGDRNRYHPYAVWWMRDDDKTTFQGDYCKTLREAIEAYERRARAKVGDTQPGVR